MREHAGGQHGAHPKPRRSAKAPVSLLLTCEHGGNLVPEELGPLFRGRRALLHSHRGWDPGALELAGHLASAMQAPLCFALISRLVVDLNRSLNNPSLWSELTASLSPAERRRLLARHYHPYRRRVQSMVARRCRPDGARCMHLSVHTFTPILRGRTRRVDIGVLFDPNRAFEARVAETLERHLVSALPRLRVRRNEPYLGTDDGLTTALRRRFASSRYAGIELEVNQRFPRRPGAGAWIGMQAAIAEALSATLVSLGESSPR